jgi:hypothetical protein
MKNINLSLLGVVTLLILATGTANAAKKDCAARNKDARHSDSRPDEGRQNALLAVSQASNAARAAAGAKNKQ